MNLAIDRNDYASNGFPLTERFGATKNEWFDHYLERLGKTKIHFSEWKWRAGAAHYGRVFSVTVGVAVKPTGRILWCVWEEVELVKSKARIEMIGALVPDHSP